MLQLLVKRLFAGLKENVAVGRLIPAGTGLLNIMILLLVWMMLKMHIEGDAVA